MARPFIPLAGALGLAALLACAPGLAGNAAVASDAAPALAAQTAPARGLPALLQRALARDPQVRAAQAALGVATARYKQARSRLLPNAGLQATRGHSSDLDSSVPVERYTQQAEASVRWNLFNGGADRVEMDAAAREVRAAEADVVRAKEESAELLAEAYFDVQRLDRTLLKAAARQDDTAQLLSQVARQAELGKASRLDLELAQSTQLDAQLIQDGLQTDRVVAQIKLATLASEPVNDFVDFAFGQADADGAPGETGRQAPLRAAQERAAAAHLRVRSLAATMAPKVDLDVRHLLNNQTTPAPSTITQRGWSIGISWDFPLGGENQARRDESLSRAEAADADLARAEQGARADLLGMAPRIANAERSVALLDEQEKKMALLVHGGAIQFEAGRRNLQQIIQTRDSYFVVQQRRIDQAHRLILARMHQLALAGQLLRAFGLGQDGAP